MISRIARLLLCLLPLVATGCGFQPLYGKAGRGAQDVDTAAALSRIQIASIPDRSGQVLRNKLIDRMYQQGRPAQPLYDLGITMTESETELGIRRDATASRARLDITVRYLLTRRADRLKLAEGYLKTSAGYNKLEAQYATLTGRENARERALSELSELIVNRIALTFGNNGEVQAERHAQEKIARQPVNE